MLIFKNDYLFNFSVMDKLIKEHNFSIIENRDSKVCCIPRFFLLFILFFILFGYSWIFTTSYNQQLIYFISKDRDTDYQYHPNTKLYIQLL